MSSVHFDQLIVNVSISFSSQLHDTQ